MGLADLPTKAEMDALRRAPAKGLPRMLTKKARQQEKLDKDDAFRNAIWARDKGCSRATGQPLKRSGLSWEEIGEVDHSIPRSIAPERIYDLSNALLLSKAENRMRKIPCPRAPEYMLFDYSGPDNRKKPQTFIWRDLDGKITKRRVG